MGMSTADARRQLLELVPGVPSYIGSVPVMRLPCDGTWFRVGVHYDYPDIFWQTLRLADAISRVKSGYFPTLKDPPDLRRYYAALREEFRLARNAEREESTDLRKLPCSHNSG